MTLIDDIVFEDLKHDCVEAQWVPRDWDRLSERDIVHTTMTARCLDCGGIILGPSTDRVSVKDCCIDSIAATEWDEPMSGYWPLHPDHWAAGLAVNLGHACLPVGVVEIVPPEGEVTIGLVYPLPSVNVDHVLGPEDLRWAMVLAYMVCGYLPPAGIGIGRVPPMYKEAVMRGLVMSARVLVDKSVDLLAGYRTMQ